MPVSHEPRATRAFIAAQHIDAHRIGVTVVLSSTFVDVHTSQAIPHKAILTSTSIRPWCVHAVSKHATSIVCTFINILAGSPIALVATVAEAAVGSWQVPAASKAK